jgi:hypothetical protein
MEFIKANYIDTTTQYTIESGTLSAANILLRDITRQWISDGSNDDATTTSVTFTLDATLAVSRLAIMGVNLKSFTVFYDGVTANTFVLTTADTTASDWSTNSNTSMYLFCTTASVSTITIDMKTTFAANDEKALGYFVASDLEVDFERIPNAKGYKPKISSKEVIHKLSDGGQKVNVIARKQSADLKIKYIPQTFRDSLKTLFDARREFIFTAFGTSTGWDEMFFPTSWQGSFDFFKYSNENPSAGFEGVIKLRER